MFLRCLLQQIILAVQNIFCLFLRACPCERAFCVFLFNGCDSYFFGFYVYIIGWKNENMRALNDKKTLISLGLIVLRRIMAAMGRQRDFFLYVTITISLQ